MPRVYPRAQETKTSGIGIDSPAACAARVVDAMDSGLSRAEAAGFCLAGSDAVLLFNQIWDEVNRQVLAARSTNPADYDTVVQYKAALAYAAPLLDAEHWYDGLKAEVGVDTFSELAAKVEELAEVSIPKGL